MNTERQRFDQGDQARTTAMRLLCLVLLLAGAPTRAAAQRHFPSDSAVRDMARRVIDVRGRIGVVIGLLEADGTRRIVSVGAAGYDGHTLFEIGSITKVFTGILLGDMVERGEVRLEQPVAELLPDSAVIPSRGGKQIRLVDLTTHSSGLPRMPNNFTPADWRNPYADYTVAQLYEFLRSHELQREPGASPEYSNLGVGLLGHALAVRADTSYDALVTMRILEPLGLTSTMITIPDSMRSRLAPGHDQLGRSVSNWDLPTLAGAGALRSSANDMLTFLAANLSPPAHTTLGRAIRRSHAPYFRRDENSGNGLGWGITDTRSGLRLLTHGGGTGGYSTYIAFDPERRIGVAVLNNRMSEAARIGHHLLDRRYPLTTNGLKRAFSVLAVTLAMLLVIGVFAAWRRTGATVWRALWPTLGIAVGLCVWMTTTSFAALFGLLRFEGRPPTMPIVFAVMVLLSVGLGVSRVGRRLAAGLPLAVLVGVQAFRLPLELMLHRAYEYGLMPVQMSYSGLNFDIVTGASAVVVAVLVATRHAGLRTVRTWNVVGTLLLLNIVIIAWLSAPTPLRVFKNAPANVWITTPPYIWLPTVMVAFAILGHIVVFRRLGMETTAQRVDAAQ